ncbi:MAG TPA: 3'-5' exonuclease, partial [Bacteroidia bacterium]|nr:3'-5' exonuclease [Bacteroidia bacterium]
YLKKDLTAANQNLSSLENKVFLREYANTHHEIADVAHRIENMAADGRKLSDIAVIYRNHRQCEDLIKYLEVKKIHYQVKKKVNLLEQPLVYKLVTVLRYIAHELHTPHSGEYLLFEIMHFDFFGIPPIESARLSLAVSKKNFRERTTSFREELINPSSDAKKAPALFDQHFGNASMRRLGEDIEYWLSQAENLTLPQLLEKIINNAGVLATVAKSEDKFNGFEMLRAFFAFVEEEHARKPGIQVVDLVDIIDLMLENRIELGFTKVSGRADGVNLITVHASKGLEFEEVFLLGCNAGVWDKAGRSGTYSLPDTLISETVSKDADVETEEARRLFFVAVTRAKLNLSISYSAKNSEGKDLERSRFVEEVAGIPATEFEKITLNDAEMAGFIETLLTSPGATSINLVDKQYLDDLLKNYSLSVTHLSAYLKCPVSFYFSYILRVPSPQNEYMAFGSAVHYALEEFFRSMLTVESKKWPEKEQLTESFRKSMGTLQYHFIPEQLERRLAYGLEILPNYYDKYISTWNKIVTVERVFRNVTLDGAVINGKMDKVEFNGKAATVVDYKTGDPVRAKTKLKRPVPLADPENDNFEDVYGGDYWRQALFYKLLMDNDKSKDWEMQFAEFDFIEPDKKTGDFTKYRVEILPDDIEAIKKQVSQAYIGITGHKFDKGCGKDECQWCNFVKFNKISL